MNVASLRDVRQIVVHGGAAHADDLLSVMLALQFVDWASIRRGEPTAQDLCDPAVLVLDVGGRHEPDLLNFDHHQGGEEVTGQCALSLLAGWLGLRSTFEVQRWWQATVLGDCAGPFAVAGQLGLPRYPFELDSPVEGAVLEMFERAERIEPGEPLHLLLEMLGATVLQRAERFCARYVELQGAVEQTKLGGVKGWVVQQKLSGQDLFETLQWLHDREAASVGFVLFHSERGPGWDGFRFNDHPALDFHRVAGRAGVVFAHPVGFFVQLADRLPVQDALALLSDCVIGD